MEFAEPFVAETELGSTESANDTKAEEVILKLEDEVNKVYGNVETRFSQLWSSASKNAEAVQEKYKLDEQSKQLMEKLNAAKENIRDGANFKEHVGQLEEQLKGLLTNANSALDTLDSKLEVVEKKAGEYASQFASFFAGVVSISAGEPANTTTSITASEQETETLFKANLSPSDNYGNSRFENDLYKLHTTPQPYTSEELDDSGELKNFNVDDKTKEIAELLEKYPQTLEILMNDLVPVKTLYKVFWYRYFKNEDKLKDLEKKRKDLLFKKGTTAEEDIEDDKDVFTWDEEEEEEEDVVDVGKVASKLVKDDSSKGKSGKSGKTNKKTATNDNNDNKQNYDDNDNDDDDDDDWE